MMGRIDETIMRRAPHDWEKKNAMPLGIPRGMGE